MLQAINDRIKGWLGAIVIGLISLPFALWGIQSYIGGAETPYAAKVGDIEITTKELDFSVNQKKQQLRERFGNQLPFEDNLIKRQVLDQVINRRILEIYTNDDGYRISNLQLSNNIKSLFSQNGDFDRAIFESMVRSRGQSIPQFENEVRKEIRVQQFSNGVQASALVTDAELFQLARLELQQREVSLLKFSLADQLNSVSVSEAEVEAAYQARAEQYMTEEQVSVDYIELTSEHIARDIAVDEQKVKRAYDDYVAMLAHTDKRKARHILIKPEPDRDAALAIIDTIKAELAQGRSFADLATQYSQDPGSAKSGGDLDWVERGQMVKPFEEALYSMDKAGDISDVVETQFGLHLIKLDEIKREAPLTLAEKRSEIEAELKRDTISSMFYDQTELLATTSYENPDSLDLSAQAVAMPVKKTALMTRSKGEGLAAQSKIREAAFSQAVLAQGLNSDVIELAPDHAVVLRVNQHIPASRLPLEQVREQLLSGLRMEKAGDIAMALAREANASIQAGTPAESLAAQGAKLDAPVTVKRTDTAKLDRAALQLAFDLPKPEAGKLSASITALGTTDVAVVIVHKVISPEKIEQSQIDALRQRRIAEIANAEFGAALAQISTAYKVQKNNKVFE